MASLRCMALPPLKGVESGAAFRSNDVAADRRIARPALCAPQVTHSSCRHVGAMRRVQSCPRNRHQLLAHTTRTPRATERQRGVDDEEQDERGNRGELEIASKAPRERE